MREQDGPDSPYRLNLDANGLAHCQWMAASDQFIKRAVDRIFASRDGRAEPLETSPMFVSDLHVQEKSTGLPRNFCKPSQIVLFCPVCPTGARCFSVKPLKPCGTTLEVQRRHSTESLAIWSHLWSGLSHGLRLATPMSVSESLAAHLGARPPHERLDGNGSGSISAHPP